MVTRITAIAAGVVPASRQRPTSRRLPPRLPESLWSVGEAGGSVVFLRFFAVVLLLLGFGGCVPALPGPETSASAAAASVPAVPARSSGTSASLCRDPALQAYVDGVGQRLLKRSGIPTSYRFVVLDLPNANAHAVSNYVFVTRGLLASLDDEAELAAALSHGSAIF